MVLVLFFGVFFLVLSKVSFFFLGGVMPPFSIFFCGWFLDVFVFFDGSY